MGVRVTVATSVNRGVRALDHLRGLRSRPPLLDVNWGNGLPAHGVLGDGVGNALGVEEVSLEVEVVHVVADKVVVDVVSDTSLATEELGLLLGLENLGTGEETTGGDTILDESGVVGAVGEERGNMSLAVGLVELLEISLKDVGTRWAGEVEGASITIVNTVDVVGRGNLGVSVFGTKRKD